MPSAEYKLIKDIIENKPDKAIEAHFGKDPAGSTRKLWPHVIGMSPPPSGGANVEMVLCYQYDGYAPASKPLEIPHVSPKNYRCFKIADLSGVTPITFVPTPPPPPPAPAWKPVKFKFKHAKRQNCVELVDEFR